jgi:hypothetical protein
MYPVRHHRGRTYRWVGAALAEALSIRGAWGADEPD